MTARGIAAAQVAVGSTWLPYLLAVLALLAVVVLAVVRSRIRPVADLTEFVLIRGSALVLIAVVVILMSDAAAEGDGLTVADRPIWSWFVEHRSAGLTGVATFITDVGGTAVMAGLAVVAMVVLWWRTRSWADPVLIAVVTAGAGLLVAVAKPIVGRVRPPEEFRLVTETNQSFPSGHALASAAILGVLVAVLVPRLTSRAVRIVVTTVVVLFVIAIGVSRLYLGVHWATDVAAGWLTGIGWMLVCLTVRHIWLRYPVSLRLGRFAVTNHPTIANRPGVRT
jgi:membrane-associated phospholipid phosphatase